MVKVDMWYGDSIKEVTKISIFFYDLDCEYRGNLYIGNKIVGDYWTKDFVALEKRFHWLTFD